MKKTLSAILCIALVISVFSTAIVMALSASASGNTAEPNYFVDFTSDQVTSLISLANQVDITCANGYTTLTSTGLDPYFFLPNPEGAPIKSRYILIVYRTNESVGGEIYVTRNDGAAMGEDSSTKIKWNTWENDGNWHTMIIDIYDMCQGGTQFTAFRFDPFSNKMGASMDIKCIAGFETLNAAQSFNIDAYLAGPSEGTGGWQIPAYQEKESTEDDT